MHKISEDEKKTLGFRANLVAYLILLIGGGLLVTKVSQKMFMQHQYWLDVQARLVKDSVQVRPRRGNLLSDEGDLMVTTLPEYKVYMDFGVPTLKNRSKISKAVLRRYKKDSLAKRNAYSDNARLLFAKELHRIFPNTSTSHFLSKINQGYSTQSRYFQLYSPLITHSDYREVEAAAYRLFGSQHGLTHSSQEIRNHPFGSLASHTLGSFRTIEAKDKNGKLLPKDRPTAGLEVAFNKDLKGEDGLKKRRRIFNRYRDDVLIPAVQGADIMTTINVNMQDICETQLRKEIAILKERNKTVLQGMVILMEVKTGYIKAIVNLSPNSNGEYTERNNRALTDAMEPGSTFKTASLMVALDDGMITMKDSVDTGEGMRVMYGSKNKDWYYARHHYLNTINKTPGKPYYDHAINVQEILEQSSNIGTAVLIDRHYKNCPEKFIDGLKRIGILDSINLQGLRVNRPSVIEPNNTKGLWSKSTLPWMSFGYNSKMAPINTLCFYNAIANNGKMMAPMLVKEIQYDDHIEHLKTKVLRQHICKASTLKEVQHMLEGVVKNGTGKSAGNSEFGVAGKTGTAQIYLPTYGYAHKRKLGSFAGYFPTESPRYSCIVVLEGASMSSHDAANVFGEISRHVYAQCLTRGVNMAIDSITEPTPKVVSGNTRLTEKALNELDISDKDIDIKTPRAVQEYRMPSVYGMGLRDAISTIERTGATVTQVQGHGKVFRQFPRAGSRISNHTQTSITLK